MRGYIPATQAQAHYERQADEYARRGFPKIASDYRWCAANAAEIAGRITASSQRQDKGVGR